MYVSKALETPLLVTSPKEIGVKSSGLYLLLRFALAPYEPSCFLYCRIRALFEDRYSSNESSRSSIER